MNRPIATVLGGTGFLRRRVVDALSREGSAMRAGACRARDDGAEAVQEERQAVAVDVRDATATRPAVAGSETLSYRELVAAVCRTLGRRRWLLPFPFALWKPLVHALPVLPNSPLNFDQLRLLAIDNVAGTQALTFQDLVLEPAAVTGPDL